MTYDINERQKAESAKMRSYDRVILLKPIEGKDVTSATGSIDKRLFTGNNKLHAEYEIYTGLWKLRYESGTLPGGLEGKFSEFQPLLDHVRNYFQKRNIEVTGVED